MRLPKLTLLIAPVILMLQLMTSGCETSKVTLYPITKTDICVKGDPDCDMCKMDVGLSEMYLKKVLEAKIIR